MRLITHHVVVPDIANLKPIGICQHDMRPVRRQHPFRQRAIPSSYNASNSCHSTLCTNHRRSCSPWPATRPRLGSRFASMTALRPLKAGLSTERSSLNYLNSQRIQLILGVCGGRNGYRTPMCRPTKSPLFRQKLIALYIYRTPK